MHDGAVQALRIILDDQLPVCLEMVDAALNHLKFRHAPRRELAVEPGQMLVEWDGARRKIDEDMSVPDRSGDGVQRIIGFAKALYFFHVRRIGQRAIEFISPGVILALDAADELALFLLAEHGTAMAADIVERADVTLFVARDDYAGIGELAEKIIANLGNLAGASSTEPHVKVNGLHLALKPSWIGVIALRQGHRFRDGDFRASVGIRGHQLNIATKPNPLKHGGKEGSEEIGN